MERRGPERAIYYLVGVDKARFKAPGDAGYQLCSGRVL